MESRQSSTLSENIAHFKIAGLAILSIRFVQGWIYWGGGSRRFIYAPEKLDPHASSWMANKIQAAMPGAIFGTEHILSYLLQHFYFLYPFIIVFSLIELISGLGLLAGLFTRFFGFVTVLLSFSLMILFGWQGGTCMDEWTMAVSNVAMGLTLALTGSSIYSVDAWLLRRFPSLQHRAWFIDCASGPLPPSIFKRVSLLCILFTVIFTLSTYNYYRGAILSKYHEGPVSATAHHVSLTKGILTPKGVLTFNAYIDSGTPSDPAYIMRVALLGPNKQTLFRWEGKELSAINPGSIQNLYAYNQFKTNAYGLVAPVGAKASITLRPTSALELDAKMSYQMAVDMIDGRQFTLPLSIQP